LQTVADIFESRDREQELVERTSGIAERIATTEDEVAATFDALADSHPERADALQGQAQAARAFRPARASGSEAVAEQPLNLFGSQLDADADVTGGPGGAPPLPSGVPRSGNFLGCRIVVLG